MFSVDYLFCTGKTNRASIESDLLYVQSKLVSYDLNDVLEGLVALDVIFDGQVLDLAPLTL